MIILLNGVSSSGKTSIACAIQDISDRMWLHIGIDTFLDMIHPKFWGDGAKATEGFLFTQHNDEVGRAVTKITVAPMGRKIAESIPDTVALLSSKGLDVIVDECLFEGEIERYKTILHGNDICYIGVMCDLETIEKREKARGDRTLGLARGMFDNVHNIEYDLTVDTAEMDPALCAKKILEFVGKKRNNA